MGLLDIFNKKEVKIEQKAVFTEHGTTWTEILSWMITEDYNSDLQFPQSITVFDEMRKSDATTIAVLRAIKNPLTSAKWQIQSWWEEKQDIIISDFVKKNLFENIKFKNFLKESLGYLDFGFYYFEKNFKIVDWMIEWKEFAPRVPRAHDLWEIKWKPWRDWHPAWVTQEIFTTDEDEDKDKKSLKTLEIPWGKLILFTNDQEWNNYEWVSILRNAYKHYFYKDLAYKVSSIASERFGVWIPIAKVKGSISSTSKKKLKELLRNIRSNEQSYWIIPDDVEELKIMTPEGTWVKDITKDIVDHHDMKIYDAILAWFLNLTTWDWWSNALSKDQSSFFLRWLQGIADYRTENLNDHIKELVDLNFSNVENYPKLTVSDIWSISMDEIIKAITELNTAWLLDITLDDRQVIRDILKLPRLTNKQVSELEKEKEEKEIKEQEDAKKQEELLKNDKKIEKEKKMAEIDWLDEYSWAVMLQVNNNLLDVIEIEDIDLHYSEEIWNWGWKEQDLHITLLYWLSEEVTRDEVKEKINYNWETINIKWLMVFEQDDYEVLVAEVEDSKFLTKTNESLKELDYRNDYDDYRPHITIAYLKRGRSKNYTQDIKMTNVPTEWIIYSPSWESGWYHLAEEKKKTPTKREKVFTKNITDFEKFLERKYKEAENIVKASEKEYQDALVEIYEGADTERIDWVVVLKWDKAKVKAWEKKIDKITKKLDKQLIDSPLQDEIFEEAFNKSVETLKDNEKLLANVTTVNRQRFDSFVKWYVSNMQGVLFNEPRRMKENLVLNFWSEASKDLSIKTANATEFNKNVLRLSFVTHPRAAYKNILFDVNVNEWFTMFKTVVPANKIVNVAQRPGWKTFSIIYTILTAAIINEIANKDTKGKTAEAVSGLGLHHWSFEYYYPIESNKLPEEEAIAKEQRARLKEESERINK